MHLSFDSHRIPPLLTYPIVIPLKSELAYKILERGRMRFWLQAEEISSKVTYKFFANNKEMSGADVRHTVVLTMENIDKRDRNYTLLLQGEQTDGLSESQRLSQLFVATKRKL